MKYDLTLRSFFDGESTSTSGTIEVDGVEHSLEISGSASERGWSGTVDGKQVATWAEGDHEALKPLDEALTDVYCEVCHKLENDGEGDWEAHVVNDGTGLQIASFVDLTDESDDEDDED